LHDHGSPGCLISSHQNLSIFSAEIFFMPTLDQVPIGCKGIISSIMGEDATAQRLMEMGVIEGEPFELVASAPMGDPLEIKVQGYRLSIRKSEAARVFVQVS
jgi:ferrous iron transport protein A